MPEIRNTQTGWQKRISDYCLENMLPISRGQVKKLAYKIHKRQQSMSEVLDFYTALRILGLVSDPTARDAIRKVEG